MDEQEEEERNNLGRFWWHDFQTEDGTFYAWCAVMKDEPWHTRSRIARYTPSTKTLTVDTEQVGVPGWFNYEVPFSGTSRQDAESALRKDGFSPAYSLASNGFRFHPY